MSDKSGTARQTKDVKVEQKACGKVKVRVFNKNNGWERDELCLVVCSYQTRWTSKRGLVVMVSIAL